MIEAPAGRGKTTTLIQLAFGIGAKGGLAVLIDLPEWAKSGRDLLDFIADMSAFRTSGLDARSLARVLEVEPVSLLFNGWNEVSENTSEAIEKGLRAAERDFPRGGILVATRAQSLRPPFVEALRVGLLPLSRTERSSYLKSALGSRAEELDAQLRSSTALDELTRTPLILREVTKIFEAGRALPTTKVGVLQSVTQLLEDVPEHRNELQRPPLSGSAAHYLSALAVQMTGLGEVTISETEARKVCSVVSRQLVAEDQLTQVAEPAAVLDALCARHVLERADYPAVAFRFEHQQFQEFYAALSLERELKAVTGSSDRRADFVRGYVNVMAWDEPLRMVAEKIGADAANIGAAREGLNRGRALIEMALGVDPIFAADLARLGGSGLWAVVRDGAGLRLRDWYAVDDVHHRQCALAGMFATGSTDFSDIIVPLLTDTDEHIRLEAYRTAREFHLSTLGADWWRVVSAWKENARKSFVSELGAYQGRAEIAEHFALNDPSVDVKIAAVTGLAWSGSSEQLTRALGGLPETVIGDVLLQLYREEIPPGFRAHALAAYQARFSKTNDPMQRIGILVSSRDLVDTDIVEVMKEELGRLGVERRASHDETTLQAALELIQTSDAEWVSQWVATRIAQGVLWQDGFLRFVTRLPNALREELWKKVSEENLEHRGGAIIELLSFNADEAFGERVFSRLTQLYSEIKADRPRWDEKRGAIFQQLEGLFGGIPAAIRVGSLSTVFSQRFDPPEFAMVTELFHRVGHVDEDESDLRAELPEELRQRLRRYLKSGVSFAASQQEVSGQLQAYLASSLASVGETEDMADLLTLIEADLKRLKEVRKGIFKGQPVHGVQVWGSWYLQAVMLLDREQAEKVALSLLKDKEYVVDAAKCLLQLATVEKQENRVFLGRKDYSLIWKARNGQLQREFIEDRRQRFASALKSRLSSLLEERNASSQPEGYLYEIQEVAVVLAALDGTNSVDLILEAATLPARWNGWRQITILETLLFSGAELPAAEGLAIVNPVIEQVLKHGLYNNNQIWLLSSALCILPFVDDPAVGIATLRAAIEKAKFPDHEMRNIIPALGSSRSPEALGFLRELRGSDASRIGNFLRTWILAVAELGGPDARKLLLAFWDPHIEDFTPPARIDGFDADLLASRIADIACTDGDIERRILQLSGQVLNPGRRYLLMKVLAALGTSEALVAGLTSSWISGQRIPYEFSKSLENRFLEHRPYGASGNTYTIVPRSSNEMRRRLFELVLTSPEDRASAFAVLGQIEVWRLEYGRPDTEPRHPKLESGAAWPALELFAM